ncbi:MAG: hypothetical protein IPH20_11880 [Bacteroidales bacterium]|nr:hypothetical protein [Bacteroidales bacterium]
MNLNDLFNQDQRRHKYDSSYRHEHDEYSHSPRSYNRDYGSTHLLIQKVLRNRKLKYLLIFVVLAIILAVIAAIILLFPLLNTILQYINENGIQGLLETIWNGSGK